LATKYKNENFKSYIIEEFPIRIKEIIIIHLWDFKKDEEFENLLNKIIPLITEFSELFHLIIENQNFKNLEKYYIEFPEFCESKSIDAKKAYEEELYLCKLFPCGLASYNSRTTEEDIEQYLKDDISLNNFERGESERQNYHQGKPPRAHLMRRVTDFIRIENHEM
jgi:hypothetical protein